MRYSISNAIPHNPKSEKHPYENLVNTVFQDICKHEVLGGFFTDKSFNLENPQKVS